MAWRGLHLTTGATLSRKDNSLVRIAGDEEIRIPIEDLSFVVVDSPEITVSTTLLSALAASNVALLLCDEKHLPCGNLLPTSSHYRHADVAATQRTMSKAFEGRLWRGVVRQKVMNQAAALRHLGKDGFEPLEAMAARIRAGDPDNIEAMAARAYWGSLFSEFKRSDERDMRNMALNYGYAIVRSVVARSCVAHGLVPAFGIHHANVYNSLNLADDLMECFRPIVDIEVATMEIAGNDEKLDKITRQSLANLPLKSMIMGMDTVGILVAADLLVESFIRAMKENDAKHLMLPGLLE